MLIPQLICGKQGVEKVDRCETCSYKFGVMPTWLAVVIYHFRDISDHSSFSDGTLK